MNSEYLAEQLLIAAKAQDTTKVLELIDAGAKDTKRYHDIDPSNEDKGYFTALHWAVLANNCEMVRALVKNGSDSFYKKARQELSAFELALRYSNDDCIEALTNRSKNIKDIYKLQKNRY